MVQLGDRSVHLTLLLVATVTSLRDDALVLLLLFVDVRETEGIVYTKNAKRKRKIQQKNDSESGDIFSLESAIPSRRKIELSYN